MLIIFLHFVQNVLVVHRSVLRDISERTLLLMRTREEIRRECIAEQAI